MEVSGDQSDFKKKLEVLEEQEDLIEDEAEQEEVGIGLRASALLMPEVLRLQREANDRQARKEEAEAKERAEQEELESRKTEEERQKAEQMLPESQVRHA